MPITDIQTWWLLGLSVLTTVNSLFTYLRKPGEDAAKAATELRNSLEAKTNELREVVSDELHQLKTVQTQLEERIRHMPTQEEVSELSGDMKAVKAQMQALIGTQAAQTMALNRIENWLINGRSK